MRLTCPSRLTRTQGQLSRDGDLLDMTGLAGAVAALHHHAPVVHEAGEQGECRIAVEHIVRIARWHVLVCDGERRHLQVRVDLEQLARRKGEVGLTRDRRFEH